MNAEEGMIAKIQKLLSLANSPNENEAKAAMEKANALLVKYNLTRQQVNERVDYVNAIAQDEKRVIAAHDMMIVRIVQEFFFVHALIVGKTNGRTASGRRKVDRRIEIFGTKLNVEIATHVFEFLGTIYPQLWKDYQTRTKAPGSQKRSYLHGVTEGIREQLKQTKWKIQEETGLVLMKDNELERHVKSMANGMTRERRMDLDMQAAAHGLADGRNVRIRKSLGEGAKESGAKLTHKGGQ